MRASVWLSVAAVLASADRAGAGPASSRDDAGRDLAAHVRARVAAADHLLWLHIPKTGGTSLAASVVAAATTRGGKIAFCYTDRGQPDCASRKPWTLRPGFRENKVDFLPPAKGDTPPSVVFGHFTLSAAARWMALGLLPGRTVTVAMLRHPLDRLFSGYEQNVRGAAKGSAPSGFDEFVGRCVEAGSRMMAIGPMLEYLGVDTEHENKTEAEGAATEWRPNAGAAPTHELVDAALAVVDDDGFVPLIQEHWDASIELLGLLGVTADPDGAGQGGAEAAGKGAAVRKRNTTPKGIAIEFGYSSVALVRQCIAPEEPVYNRALAKFLRMYRALSGKELDLTPRRQ